MMRRPLTFGARNDSHRRARNRLGPGLATRYRVRMDPHSPANRIEPSCIPSDLTTHAHTIYGYHMTDDMVKTTVYLKPADYRRIQELARQKGLTAASLVREAVALYAHQHAPPARPRSLGAGHSGRGDLSERAEELLGGLGRA